MGAGLYGVIATRVSAGLQPVRNALPQLLPDGLGPDLHLRAAHSVAHPFTAQPIPPTPIDYSIKHALRDADAAVSHRETMLKQLEELAAAVVGEDDEILKLVHVFIRPVVAKRRIAFMREVSLAAGWHDPTFLIGLAFGLPALGWACRATTMPTRWAPPEIPISDLLVDLASHNTAIIASTRRSKDKDLDFAAWEKSMTELKNEFIVGPYRHLDEIPGSGVRLLRRFGTWEQHGGAVEPTCRLIDDALAGGQNRASGSQHTHRPTDLDAWIAQVRVIQETYPKEAVEQFASDFASAYKQVPGDPATANLAVIAQWCPMLKKPVFFVGRTQFFGGKSCPVNFARVPDWGCHLVASLGAVPMSHCVDDMLCTDRKTTILSGFRLWRGLARLAGWDVPDRKSPPPSPCSRVLGVMSDLSPTPHAPPLVRVTPDRVELLVAALSKVIENGHLTSGLAGKLWGRLQFASTQAYGRIGKAMLRAFNRRQHEEGRVHLNSQLKASIQWWLQNLPRLPERPVPTDFRGRPVVISYSDGEGAQGQVGIALWRQGYPIGRAGVISIPPDLRSRWDERQKLCRFNDIYEVEAVGPLLVLHNFGRELAGCLWLHFVDNAAALSTLVRGSSSVESGEHITGLTWSHIVGCGCFPWFDRVESDSNPTDGLSRGRLQGPWVLEQIQLPRELWP